MSDKDLNKPLDYEHENYRNRSKVKPAIKKVIVRNLEENMKMF